MRWLVWLLPLSGLGLACLQCRPIGPPAGQRTSASAATPVRQSQPVSTQYVSASALLRSIQLKVDMVQKGRYGRKVTRPMKPRYITVHSTQNYTADAERHSVALKRGALTAAKRRGGNRIGYLIWHFTVDDRQAIQHMPVSEQGEHADFDGPGNRYSIGIEMCENRGGNRAQTVERTAKLTAYLMMKHQIPLRNVVPHYHWPRKGRNPPNKNCPHFLMDNGRPGRKWSSFLGKVNFYYKQLETQQLASR